MNTPRKSEAADSASFARSQSEIDALARETHTESTVVRRYYENEVAQLQATATVRPFISVIAWRHVSLALRKDASERDAHDDSHNFQ